MISKEELIPVAVRLLKTRKDLPVATTAHILKKVKSLDSLPPDINNIIDDVCNPTQLSRLRHLHKIFALTLSRELSVGTHVVLISDLLAKRAAERGVPPDAFEIMLNKLDVEIYIAGTNWRIIWYDPLNDLLSLKDDSATAGADDGYRLVRAEIAQRMVNNHNYLEFEEGKSDDKRKWTEARASASSNVPEESLSSM